MANASRRDPIFGVHPPECLVCCLRILAPHRVRIKHMNKRINSAKDENFFGRFGNSLHFKSPDECHPENEMLKLQQRLTRKNMRKFKPEFERWILQLYLRWAFTHSSNYFRLPFTISKIPEKQEGSPDFLCHESEHGYALEVTQSTMQWQQKMLGDKSGPIEE